MADRWGRRPVISSTVLLYALFTLLTALSRGLTSFTLFQSTSQMFLAAEFGVAIVIIGEEFPDDLRGRGISLLHMVSLLGVMAAGALYGPVAASPWGWRGMYLLGIAPLILVAWLRRGMRETARFLAARAAGLTGGFERAGLRERWQAMLRPFRGPSGGRLLLVAALWNSIGLVGAPTITFFSLYVRRDRGWSSGQVGAAIVLAYAMGSAGSLLSGFLMDKIGRRATTSLYYLGAALAMLMLFRAHSHAAILTALIATMFAYQGSRTATSTLSAELFPTEIRATCYSLTVQVVGQIAWLLAPLMVGLLSGWLGGLAKAASLFAVGPLIGVVLVMVCVPETGGKSLEELAAAE